MNVFLIAAYVLFAVLGSTLLKYGGIANVKKIAIPLININFSWITLLGLIFYGISFIVYTILLNKYDLSLISPVTVALVYIFLMITAFIIFKEPITVNKITGSVLILIGILLILKK